METTYPKLRHINCQVHKCETCMDDHIDLQVYLSKRTDRNDLDHLGRYHRWLSENGINPETEWGWASQETFEPKNIENYIAFIRGEQNADKEISFLG